MTTAACTSPSAVDTAHATPGAGLTGIRLAGTRVTSFARSLRRQWRERRDALIPVGPEPAGPWAGSDGPDRDRIRMQAERG